jgi:hypothetical protein
MLKHGRSGKNRTKMMAAYPAGWTEATQTAILGHGDTDYPCQEDGNEA